MLLMGHPKNVVTYDLSTSTIWFDEVGILWSLSRKVPPPTFEQTKSDIEKLRTVIGNRKVCMLLDVTHAPETTREIRELAAQELPKITKAIAMVSHSKLGKMLANLFFSLQSQPYPVKMFNTTEEAKQWLLKHV
jgi:hypothetical protein